MAVAEVLGVEYEDVRLVPFVSVGQPSGSTAASSGLPTVTSACWDAAREVRQKLLNNAASILDVDPSELDTKDKTVYVKADPTKTVKYTDVLKTFGLLLATGVGKGITDGALAPKDPETGKCLVERGLFASCVEVEVDIDTGKVEVVNIMSAPQGGTVVAPDVLRGQILGGLTHGASQMLGEGYIYDESTGTPLNCSTCYYPILSAMDVSEEMYDIVVDSNPAHAPTIPFHAKGLAEGIYAAFWPAFNMAVYNAIAGAGGTRIREYPFKPERILDALGKAKFPKTKSVA